MRQIFEIMNDKLNERLISAMREELPDNSNLAQFLMEILSLGKEAVYRRLRGEVVFTFEDVARISRKLGVSLDKVVCESKVFDEDKWVFVNTSTLSSSLSTKYIEQYKKKLKTLSEIINDINKPKAVFRNATCQIPFFLLIPYKTLITFCHYKRAYLIEGTNPKFRLSDLSIPQELYDAERSLYKISSNIPKQLLILDRRCFLVMVEDINYFYQRNLISAEERLQLKNELSATLLQLEKIAATGKYNENVEVSLYLCDVNLASSYAHFEANNYQVAMQLIYLVDLLIFYAPKVCQIQKEWIESLKRYSTLISETGEVPRLNFFETQREILEALN